QALGSEVPLRTLFERPTVAGMAEVLAERAQRSVGPVVRSTGRGSRQPLSFAQLRFWLRHQQAGASNIPTGVALSGSLDLAALERSLREIVRRHEVLRASFEEIAGEPVQVIRHPGSPLVLPVVDLTALPESRREEEARGLGILLGLYPFDLAR